MMFSKSVIIHDPHLLGKYVDCDILVWAIYEGEESGGTQSKQPIAWFRDRLSALAYLQLAKGLTEATEALTSAMRLTESEATLSYCRQTVHQLSSLIDQFRFHAEPILSKEKTKKRKLDETVSEENYKEKEARESQEQAALIKLLQPLQLELRVETRYSNYRLEAALKVGNKKICSDSIDVKLGN